jgi:hypothetical protein
VCVCTEGYYAEGDESPNYSKQRNSHEVAEELFLLHLEPDQGRGEQKGIVSHAIYTLLLQQNFQLCTRTLGEFLKYPYHTSLFLYKNIDLSIIKDYFII